MGAESRLTELKLVLPPAPQPVATYVTAVRQGELLYVSGHGPFRSDKTMITGKIGADLDIDQGKAAAADWAGDPGDHPQPPWLTRQGGPAR